MKVAKLLAPGLRQELDVDDTFQWQMFPSGATGVEQICRDVRIK